ncbi:hypothetical protein COB57_05610 [Candidatus Peregrinibacteria bacterium]|nr:MAG: hypothetical protein COB57_05610 [Candidatus Peregrinibacteria bacterium]
MADITETPLLVLMLGSGFAGSLITQMIGIYVSKKEREFQFKKEQHFHLQKKGEELISLVKDFDLFISEYRDTFSKSSEKYGLDERKKYFDKSQKIELERERTEQRIKAIAAIYFPEIMINNYVENIDKLRNKFMDKISQNIDAYENKTSDDYDENIDFSKNLLHTYQSLRESEQKIIEQIANIINQNTPER